MTEEQRLDRLLQIAAQDPFYAALHSSLEKRTLPFYRFVSSQSARERTAVNAYVYMERIMLQRLARLACAHMTFPDE